MSESRTHRFNVHDTEWSPFPEFGGHEAILYRSPDGTRLAASFRLSGTHSWQMPYDDTFFVIAGTALVTVEDEEPFEIRAGDFCHIAQGSNVTFAMSDDFHEVSVLVSNTPFDHESHAAASAAT